MKVMDSHFTTGRAFRLSLGLTLLLAGASTALGEGDFDLTFQGGTSFQGPHGGQTVHAALVDTDSQEVVAVKSSSVAGGDDPAFSFTFEDALKQGEAYEVHYWIDSNFGGGSEGQCDGNQHDHQWRVALPEVDDDIMHSEEHDPSRLGDVCTTFAGDS